MTTGISADRDGCFRAADDESWQSADVGGVTVSAELLESADSPDEFSSADLRGDGAGAGPWECGLRTTTKEEVEVEESVRPWAAYGLSSGDDENAGSFSCSGERLSARGGGRAGGGAAEERCLKSLSMRGNEGEKGESETAKTEAAIRTLKAKYKLSRAMQLRPPAVTEGQ